jgi:carbamoyl-phosphate synthase small subunit
MSREPAAIVLRDGRVFEGWAAGAAPDNGVATGEFVFNTALSGYQEVLTDPSYAGQIVAFTYPHIGNYGVCGADDEADRPHCRGLVVRDLSAVASNWRSSGTLEAYCAKRAIPIVTGIDTRALTRHLRDAGAIAGAFGTASLETLRAAASTATGTDGCDLVGDVTTSGAYRQGNGDLVVVAFDFGIKRTMVRQLAERFTVHVIPATTSAADVADLAPDGVFLSNGPGDPAALTHLVQTIEALVGRYPIFGICLGHQLLARALGASTYKLPFGHHGSNHPVMDLRTSKVEITAQNHNYAVDQGSLTSASVTHRNLNDDVIEGLADPHQRCFSVQYHPEAGPGPHDARYLFDRYEHLMRTGQMEH